MGKHEFYQPDGFCKICNKKISAKSGKYCKECYTKRKYERRKNYQKEYYKKWYAKNGRKRKKDYFLVIEEWRRNHPEAIKVRGIVQRAILAGNLKRPDKCEKCNSQSYIVAHHSNYKKPLNIKWLCQSCHKKLHLKKSFDKNLKV